MLDLGLYGDGWELWWCRVGRPRVANLGQCQHLGVGGLSRWGRAMVDLDLYDDGWELWWCGVGRLRVTNLGGC